MAFHGRSGGHFILKNVLKFFGRIGPRLLLQSNTSMYLEFRNQMDFGFSKNRFEATVFDSSKQSLRFLLNSFSF